MIAAVQSNMAASTPDLSGVEFATSADGLPVARIGDLVLAMVFSPSGFSYLGHAGAVRRPLAELTRADFIGHDGRIADEAEFLARVAEATGHKRDLASLDRVRTRMSASTPWGGSQMAVIYADGIVFHMTSGHGGPISQLIVTPKSILCYARTRRGTRKIVSGRSWLLPSRTCSPPMSGPWPRRPFAISGPTPGR